MMIIVEKNKKLAILIETLFILFGWKLIFGRYYIKVLVNFPREFQPICEMKMWFQ